MANSPEEKYEYLNFLKSKSILTDFVLNYKIDDPKTGLQQNFGEKVLIPYMDYISYNINIMLPKYKFSSFLSDVKKLKDIDEKISLEKIANFEKFVKNSTISLKGGLATLDFLNDFLRYKNQIGIDDIDEKTTRQTLLKISDYDTTVTLKTENFTDDEINIYKNPEQNIYTPWWDTMVEIFRIIEDEICSNPKIHIALSELVNLLRKHIFTEIVTIEGSNQKYNGILLKNIPELFKTFNVSESRTERELTDPNNPDSYTKFIIDYKNKDNLYLILKNPDNNPIFKFKMTDNELKTKYPMEILRYSDSKDGVNAMSALTFKSALVPGVKGTGRKYKFLLSRIMGNLMIYEKIERKGQDRKNIVLKSSLFSVKLSKSSIIPFTYQDHLFYFEMLDISLNGDFDRFYKESKLGEIIVETDNKLYEVINKKIIEYKNFITNKEIFYKKQPIQFNVYKLNIGAILYDFYSMFNKNTSEIDKADKRCLRLLIFLKVYRILKQEILRSVENDQSMAMFLSIPDPIIRERQIFTYLSTLPSDSPIFRTNNYSQIKYFDDLVSSTTPEERSRFVENLQIVCLKTKDPDINKFLRELRIEYGKTDYLVKFVNRILPIYDLLKTDNTFNQGFYEESADQKTVEKFIDKDIDITMRQLLVSNVNIWKELSNKMFEVLKSLDQTEQIYYQGGVKFIEDVKDFYLQGNDNFITDLYKTRIDFIKNLIEQNIISSYDIDSFILKDDMKSVDNNLNILRSQKFIQYPLLKQTNQGPDTYWEIVSDIKNMGIYKKNELLFGGSCQNIFTQSCYIFFNFLNFVDDKLDQRPYKLLRANIILKNISCIPNREFYYVPNVVDFNFVDLREAHSRLLSGKNEFSFLFAIMILLKYGQIDIDMYLYLSCLFFYAKQIKPYNNFIRLYFYKTKIELRETIYFRKTNPGVTITMNDLIKKFLIYDSGNFALFFKSIELELKDKGILTLEQTMVFDAYKYLKEVYAQNTENLAISDARIDSFFGEIKSFDIFTIRQRFTNEVVSTDPKSKYCSQNPKPYDPLDPFDPRNITPQP